MAAKTASKDLSIDEKLQQLWELQQIDTKIDKIQILKGELPIEVKDLEDEVEGLRTRLQNSEAEAAEMEEDIKNRKNAKALAKELISRYEKQQNNVKNNREYDALSKEIELQKLEIQLCEKKINDATAKIDSKQAVLEETEKQIKEREKNLKNKKKELEKIIEETELEEKELQKESDKQAKKVEERLLKAYTRIRGAYKNGLAVVAVLRDACGGCYAKIPPQRQLEIRQRKRIITCEHCGRILVAWEEPESAE
ncbi:MAG TPA: C4-type zinc ribbon domain-containing protein [Chitinophagales bacterium]|nr:C4-type zinc ribbon domain-containing protein [Chitinophagales bacterium]